jgi:protein-disulfide isomerase/uncharacterized membrane protein
MSERVNCDTVALSEFAVFFGLPVSLWGLVGYLGMGALAVWGLRKSCRGDGWPLGLCFWLGLACSVLSVALYLISHLVIESVCVVCAGTYLVNLGLAFVGFMALRWHGSGVGGSFGRDLRAIARAPISFALFSGTWVAVLVVLHLTVPTYWRVELSTGPGGLPVGVSAAGHPWIGATDPLVEIEEYSDYQCPHCQRGHDDVRRLVERLAGQVRLVHRHYPLDDACNTAMKRPFHPHACRYALLSFCAQEQGLFWEANDYFFAHGRRRSPVTAEELASHVGLDAERLRSCADGERARRAIERDLASGRAQRVRGTPTFVVNGENYPGRLPVDVVRAALSSQRGAE